MRTEIIEILQKAYPEYCLKHIDTANEILRLFSVVGRSEQVCHICGGKNGHTIECTSWCGNTVTI